MVRSVLSALLWLRHVGLDASAYSLQQRCCFFPKMESKRQAKLLAPILVTPTKPMTPSHLKAFLWLDTLYKATALIHDVTYLHNRTTYDVAHQTLAFWIDLDERFPDADYSDKSETWIGERYVEFHAARRPVEPDRLRAYRRRVEEEAFLHPASRRILDIWSETYAFLNLHDPDLKAARPFQISVDETLDRLTEIDVLLDTRKMGGGVYLDFTGEGLPLRQLIDEQGLDNYLLSTLRELLPLAEAYDSVALLCDAELDLDYLLVERALRRLGCPAVRMTLGRVPLDGQVQSSRGGGWQAYTFDKLVDGLREKYDLDTIRLGMRLYFIVGLGKGAKQSFRFDLLAAFMDKAQAFLAKERQDEPSIDAALTALRRFTAKNHGYVDPYQLTSALLSRKKPIDFRPFLRQVFL